MGQDKTFKEFYTLAVIPFWREAFSHLVSVNLLAGLVAYTYRESKPALDLLFKGLPTLPLARF